MFRFSSLMHRHSSISSMINAKTAIAASMNSPIPREQQCEQRRNAFVHATKHDQNDIEKLDSRGRTPLMLAVKLCHLQSVKELLAAKANANVERNGWSVVQEAICSGDANIVSSILEVRDLQRHIQRVTHVPQLLQKLVDAPDFYVEMKWEFTSWGECLDTQSF